MSGPVDARGRLIQVGNLVAFATSDRYSNLQFGTVDKINVKDTTRWDRDEFGNRIQVPDKDYSVRFLLTDAHGNPKFETEYDPNMPNPDNIYNNGMGKHVETDKQSKSGYVQAGPNKFLILS